MTAARKIADLTEDEFRALIREELRGGKVDAPKPAAEDAAPVKPTLEDFMELNARRARRGRRHG